MISWVNIFQLITQQFNFKIAEMIFFLIMFLLILSSYSLHHFIKRGFLRGGGGF